MGRLVEKIKGVGGLILSAAVLIVSLSIAASTIFGWFSIREDAVQEGFEVRIVGGVRASLKIDGNQYAADGLSLRNIVPGEEYIFEITVLPSDSGWLRVYFINPSGEFEEGGEIADMCDVMGIRVISPEAFAEETYATVSEMGPGYMIVNDLPVSSGASTVIVFALRFLETAPGGKDLNIYQGREFHIETLVIEKY